jgi:hypothetical protein
MNSTHFTRLWIAAAIVALAAAGFVWFPGHTFLQSDTQIYVPILERLRDPSVLSRDLLSRDAHVAFTIYDEVTLLVSRVSGVDLRWALLVQEFVFRALGLVGVYLIASALSLRARLALLVTAIFALGAAVAGPAVLTIEYEPVPRGFAIPLLLLAIGLIGHGQHVLAGIAASLAFLYHPPSVLPFWAVYFGMALWPSKPEVMRRRILGLMPLLAGVLLMLALSRMQAGVAERQDFFGRISPELEQIQRERAPYNWVSLWPGYLLVQYVFLCAFSLAAFLRVRKSAPRDLRFFLAGLPVFGLAMLPASYLLLDKLKWIGAPQVQPARAVLFLTAFTVILGGAAAMLAAGKGRYWESVLWLLPVFTLPASGRVFELLLPDLSVPLVRIRALVVLGLAVLTALAAWAVARNRRGALALWIAAALLPFYAIPRWGHMTNFGPLHTTELAQLASWARTSTPKDAVFLFPDAGHDLAPGVFRATALRALYVDWKSGGQVNFLQNFAREWASRWAKSGACRFVTPDLTFYRALGVDYIVLKSAHCLASQAPAFSNPSFVVYNIASSVNLSGRETSNSYEDNHSGDAHCGLAGVLSGADFLRR